MDDPKEIQRYADECREQLQRIKALVTIGMPTKALVAEWDVEIRARGLEHIARTSRPLDFEELKAIGLEVAHNLLAGYIAGLEYHSRPWWKRAWDALKET